MQYAWKSKARPMPADAFRRAAERLNCEEAAIRAVWRVESAGSGFQRDGSLTRRFEPHHIPGAPMTWRESLKLSERERSSMFLEYWAKDPEATARASSWGGPQIMGFNAVAAGHSSALAMVSAMAADAGAQLDAFVSLVLSWGLATKLRAHDWLGFAKRYNGTGQPRVYASRIEKAYRALTGKASPVVLSRGARGAAVKRLQLALGVKPDGDFGDETHKALVRYQDRAGLLPDGKAGALTWKHLEAHRAAKPITQSVNPIAAILEALLMMLKGVSQ